MRNRGGEFRVEDAENVNDVYKRENIYNIIYIRKI